MASCAFVGGSATTNEGLRVAASVVAGSSAASFTSFMRLAPFHSSVGASGAIFGVMGAFIFSVWRSPVWRHDRSARAIVKQCLFWMVANILIASQFPQIDNAAHIGGLVAGMLLGAVLPHATPPPPPPAQVVIDVAPYEE